MSNLVFGKNGQVRFNSEEELRIAIEYILSSDNADFNIHGDNQNQGAWASEERIHFKSERGVPECLKRNMTAGKAGSYGRINCKEFCDMVRAEARRQ